MKFFETRLPNGLTIIGEQRKTAVSVALGVFVRTGARDEDDDVSGVSHFLEHMIFKGTEKRSALDITYAMGAIGAQANAFTSEECTVYHMAVLPEYFSEALELLCDMLRPSLDPQEFAVEKNVILEEIALYRDRPTHILFERARREFFHSHPAGNSVLGTTESISALTQPQMKKYFDSRYTATNMIVAASGNFEWDRLVKEVTDYAGKWPGVPVHRELGPNRPEAKSLVITKEELQIAHLAFLAPGPSANDELRHAVQVLSCILGDSTGSRVYWELVDKGLVETAAIDVDEMDQTGMIVGYLSASPENLEAAAEILEQILNSPLDFSAGELERAKTKFATRLVLQGESTMRRLMATGFDWLYRGAYVPLEAELAKLQAVSRDDIERAVAAYPPKPVTRVRLLPA